MICTMCEEGLHGTELSDLCAQEQRCDCWCHKEGDKLTKEEARDFARILADALGEAAEKGDRA